MLIYWLAVQHLDEQPLVHGQAYILRTVTVVGQVVPFDGVDDREVYLLGTPLAILKYLWALILEPLLDITVLVY